MTSALGSSSVDAAWARAQRPPSLSPSQPMTTSGLLQGAPGQTLQPVLTTGLALATVPSQTGRSGQGQGMGTRLERRAASDLPGARRPRPARAPHSPGMGDEVVHGDLDRFPFDDFFECFEDEFIVKGIWRNQSVKGFLNFKTMSAVAVHRASLQICVFRMHVTPQGGRSPPAKKARFLPKAESKFRVSGWTKSRAVDFLPLPRHSFPGLGSALRSPAQLLCWERAPGDRAGVLGLGDSATPTSSGSDDSESTSPPASKGQGAGQGPSGRTPLGRPPGPTGEQNMSLPSPEWHGGGQRGHSRFRSRPEKQLGTFSPASGPHQ